MQPKTKFQKLVAGLKSKLKPVTPDQIQWGFDNCFEHSGTLGKNTAGCLECGHSWGAKPTLINSLVGCTCPECGKELKMEVTRKKKKDEVSYFAILTTVSEFQVIRMFFLTKYCKLGGSAHLGCTEVMQHWINGKGDSLVFSKLVNGFSNCYDNWILPSNLELKGSVSTSSNLRNSIVPNKIFPKRRILDTIKRNGFNGHFYGISPINFFKLILTDTRAETLLKSKQISLLQYYYDHRSYQDNFNKQWNSVKICIRNGYIVKDGSMWMDYVQLLTYFNKDLLNGYFVCPVDLKKSHDKLVDKKRKVEKRRKIEQLKKEIEFRQIDYEKEKGKFFGISFSNGALTVKVLETVEEFLEESLEHGHCVFSNGYYKKRNSLVLSAKIGDKHIETVEVSLTDLKILQARGKGNKPTVHHGDIISLVNNNLHTISRLIDKQA